MDHCCLILLVSSFDSLLKLAHLDLHHLVSVLINVGCEVYRRSLSSVTIHADRCAYQIFYFRYGLYLSLIQDLIREAVTTL